MKTAFFLRSSSDGQASIYIRITEGRGDQFKFATGHAILHPDHWNKTKQRVRNKVDAVGCDEVNVQLEKLQAFVRQAHLDAKTKGQRRDRDFYQQVIQDFKRGVERSSVGQTLTIGEAFERFIDHASKHNSPITGSRLSKGTLENYAVTLRQIQHVLMDVTTLDEVDMDWYHDFVSKSEQSGLNGKPLSKNYIGRHIKGVKSVLAAMEEQGHDVHPAYRRKGFKKITEDSTSIWLTMEELKQMEALDLSAHPPGLALTRDLFLIGCFTGLRVSDLNRLQVRGTRHAGRHPVHLLQATEDRPPCAHPGPSRGAVHPRPPQRSTSTAERPNHQPQPQAVGSADGVDGLRANRAHRRWGQDQGVQDQVGHADITLRQALLLHQQSTSWGRTP